MACRGEEELTVRAWWEPEAIEPGGSFGRWAVVEAVPSSPAGEGRWLCRCRCGPDERGLREAPALGPVRQLRVRTARSAGAAAVLRFAAMRRGVVECRPLPGVVSWSTRG